MRSRAAVYSPRASCQTVSVVGRQKGSAWSTEREVPEDGWFETIPTRHSPNPHSGYEIPTIGKRLPEIKTGVEAFITHAQAHPEMRFHVRKLGYHEAGFSIAQIAPLFAPAIGMPNVLLPAELLAAIKKEDALLGTSAWIALLA